MNQPTWFLSLAIVIGLLAGCLLGAQPSANGQLGRYLAHPLQAATISFATGTLLLILCSVLVGQFPPKFSEPITSLPWWVWIGGAIGTVLVTSSLYFVPRVGSLYWFAAVMTGQVLAALVLDQFGLMGNPRQPANLLRIIGALFLVAGVLCITYSRTTGIIKTDTIEPSMGTLETESRATENRSNK